MTKSCVFLELVAGAVGSFELSSSADFGVHIRRLQRPSPECLQRCPGVETAYRDILAAQDLEDPKEALDAIHVAMCSNEQAFRCVSGEEDCAEATALGVESGAKLALQVACSCFACPSFNPWYPLLAQLTLAKREQFHRENATKEILCPMVGSSKCAISKDSCQTFDEATMNAVVQMEAQCLREGFSIGSEFGNQEQDTSATTHQFVVQLLWLGNVINYLACSI